MSSSSGSPLLNSGRDNQEIPRIMAQKYKKMLINNINKYKLFFIMNKFSFLLCLCISTPAIASEFYDQSCFMDFTKFIQQIRNPKPKLHSPIEVLFMNTNTHQIESKDVRIRVADTTQKVWKLIRKKNMSSIYTLLIDELFDGFGAEFPVTHFIQHGKIDYAADSTFWHGGEGIREWAKWQTEKARSETFSTPKEDDPPKIPEEDEHTKNILSNLNIKNLDETFAALGSDEKAIQFDADMKLRNPTHTLILIGGPGYVLDSQIKNIMLSTPHIRRVIVVLSSFFSPEIDENHFFRDSIDLFSDGQLIAQLAMARNIQENIQLGPFIVNRTKFLKKYAPFSAYEKQRTEGDRFLPVNSKPYKHIHHILNSGEGRIAIPYEHLNDRSITRHMTISRYMDSLTHFLDNDSASIDEGKKQIIFIDQVE